MAKLPLYVAIIFLMIAGCIGPKIIDFHWDGTLDRRLMDIFYGTYPDDELHWERVKQAWDSQLPEYSELPVDNLASHVEYLKTHYLNEWQKRPPTEREKLEDILTRIYKNTNSSLPHHAMRMFYTILENFPNYAKEPELIRTVVYRWYELYAPIGKGIFIRRVDWTPQRIANLLHIHEQVRRGESDLSSRIKERWMKMYEHLNVSEEALVRCLYKFKSNKKYEPSEEEKLEAKRRYKSLFPSEKDVSEEGGSVYRGTKKKWDSQMNTDVLHIDNMIRHFEGNLAPAMKDRWEKMQPRAKHLTGKSLLNRVSYLRGLPFESKLEDLLDSKSRYDALPPIPDEILSKGGGKWRRRKVTIPRGQESNQQHVNEPAFQSPDLPLEKLKLLQQDPAGIDSSYAVHVNYPNQNYYYGSSSHTPIDQGHYAALPDTRHLHQDFWHPGGSSSHIPVHPGAFSSLPDVQYSREHSWNPDTSSSYSLIHEDSSGMIAVTPRPRSRQLNHRSSSNHTSVQRYPSDSHLSISHPHHDSSGSGGGSSRTSIHEDPSGLIVVTSRPLHHQQDHRGSSSHTSVYPGPSHSQPDTPRPNQYQWIPGRESRHYQRPPQ